MNSKEKSCLNCPAWPKSIFKDFNEAQLQDLKSKKVPEQFQKNESFFKQGQEVRGLFCNGSGLLKVIQKNQSDKVIFSRFVYPGDTVGHRSIFVEDCYKGTCNVVSEQAEVCFINKKEVITLFSENTDFAKALIAKISGELERSVDEHILMRESTAFSRLCALLVRLFDEYSEKTAEEHFLRAAISKVDIARCLSMADETVIRFMSELQKDGIIELRDKKIHLLNEKKLRQYSQ